MNYKNFLKWLLVAAITTWSTADSCLAQAISGAPSSTPTSASDQQNEAKSLVGKRGEQQVDLFTGSFGYSIPIACAPARNNSQPSLALAYSSGGENGWCGVGWKLDIGYIERNTKDGFPIKFSTAAPPAPLNQYDDNKGFILNLFGKELKLLRTATANEYRPEVDTEFLRCVFDASGNKWMIYDKSGNIYYFGKSSSSTVVNSKSGWPTSGQPASAATFRWALDQIETVTGDRTTIAYTTYNSEKTLYPTTITYNYHDAFNGYGATFSGQHTITFTTEVRPDKRFSYRSGFRTEQNRRLTTITCKVGTQSGTQSVWRYVLDYGSVSTATKRSLLHTLTTYGSDDHTALPVQTFTYQGNPKGVSFGSTIHWNGLNLATPDSPSLIQPWMTQVNNSQQTLADLMDIDGDGLPDRVSYDDTGTAPYRYQVQRNKGLQADGKAGNFDTRYIFKPTSSGNGTTPSDSNPVNPVPDDYSWTMLNEPHVRIRDINGDGLPDRVCDYWKPFYNGNTPGNTAYDRFEVMLNSGSGFSAAAPWSIDRGPYTAPGIISSADINFYACVESGGVNTGLFDINGDGLPDRVMSMYYTEGAMTYFRVQFNTGTGFLPVKLFGPYHSQNYNDYPTKKQTQPWRWAGIETPDAHMIDINGDGLPDRVMYPMKNSTGAELDPPANSASTYYAIEYNDGYSFEAVNISTNVPGAADQWPGVFGQTNHASIRYDAINGLPYVGMFDLNGDGLPDRVMLDETSFNTTSPKWRVYMNNGVGFDLTPIIVSNIDDQGQHTDRGWMGIESAFAGSSVVTLMDINGDGLLDRVMAVYNNGVKSNSPYFLVQLNEGPFPDLLTGIDNGIGGVLTVAYKSSTAYDNSKVPGNPNSGSALPFPMQTVASVTSSDGVNSSLTTTYSYAGGFFDGVRREFAGFAVVTNTDPSMRKTITYFHTGGGRDYSSLGEYQDVVSGAGSFAKRGMPYRIETYGNDTPTPLLYHMVINQVDQTKFSYTDPNNTYIRYFPFVSQSFEYDYPNVTPNNPKITGSKFVYSQYDTTPTYNLTQKILWGEVSGVNLTTFATPTDVLQSDTQYHQISYATISGNSDIKDHPDTVSLTSDAAGSAVVQQTKYTYNASSGTTATEQTRICSGTFAVKTYDNYNAYGLADTITDEKGVQTYISAWDASYVYPATTRVRVTPGANTDDSGGAHNGDHITTDTYDLRSGLLATSTDPMGINMQNTYDVFYRLTETDKGIIPGGDAKALWVKKLRYPALGVITAGNAVNYVDVSINDGVLDNGAENGVESRTYIDGFARPIQSRTQGENGNFRVVSTAYDNRGEAFLTTWPRLEGSIGFTRPSISPNPQPATFIDYDPAGRVKSKFRRADATFDATTGAVISSSTDGKASGDTGSPLAAERWVYFYDNGNGPDPWWKISTDEDGKIRRYQLDAFGRTHIIQEVSGGTTYATTTLSYDLAGNLTQINNANNENIYYGYDDAGNKLAMADPSLGQWTYQRDAAGRLRVQTDARRDVVAFTYVNPATGRQDPLGRVQQKSVYNSVSDYNANTPASTATYIYDTSDDPNYTVYKGELYKVTDGEGWEKNGYDARGRLTKTTRHLNVNNQDYTTTYAYNDGDKVTSISYPSAGPTINYTYFHGGSINLVTRNGSSYNYYSASASNFDEFGHVTSFTYGNQVTTTRSYYANSKRLQAITVGTSGSIMSKTYTYSDADDVLSISGTGLGSSGGSGSVAPTYDDLHRILTYGSASSYTYDKVGNIQTDREPGGTSATYNYGSARQQAVKGAQGKTYLYDLCGNMIVRRGDTAGSQAMAYDAENRLTRFSQVGSMPVVDYGYAEDGTRLWKRVNQDPSQVQVWIGNIYEEKGGKTLFHVFAGNQQVCTFEAGSLLAGGSDSSKVGYYYHQDNLNSSSVLSGSSGSQTEVNVYYPFGRVQTAMPQATFKVSRQFTGQIKDDETGLYYYNARYYDPELGRFIQPDDIIPNLDNPQSYNRYSYVMNNPLRYTDPDGHGPIDDALFNTETIKSSYQLMVMNDSVGWKFVEVPTAVIGMAAGVADAAFNVASFGVKGAFKGGIKQLFKAGVEASGKEAAKAPEQAAKAAKEAAEVSKDAKSSAGAVKPGDAGTYGELKSKKAANGETEPLDMDHQPSFAAQVKAKESQLGKKLSAEEREELRNNTPAVASPRKIHQQTSPTYGGRNNSAQITADAANLDAAAARDKAAFDKAMSER